MLQAREGAAGMRPPGPGASLLVGSVGHLSCRRLEGNAKARVFQNALGMVAFWLQADIQDCVCCSQVVLLGG